MERKTKVHAEEGKQALTITRTFDLPLALLFRAYAEAELVERWMGTKVIRLESRNHGSWRNETSDPQGKIVFSAHGVIHEFIPQEKIIRTFEMEQAPFGVQLEIYRFEAVTGETS